MNLRERTAEWAEKRNEESLEIFDTPVYFVNGMVRLRDIQAAYLKAGGEKSEEATRPANWGRRKSTEELIEYLETEDEIYSAKSDTIKATPHGDRGGVYVCRELAHDYAMWLDKRYAVAVLRAFDRLVSYDFIGASEVAKTVVRRMLVEDWKARRQRIEAAGLPYQDMIYVLMSCTAGANGGTAVDKFMDGIVGNEAARNFFNRLMNAAETQLYITEDAVEAANYAWDLYGDSQEADDYEAFVKEILK